MTPAEVAKALSPREFNTLCALVDATELPKRTLLINGSEVVSLAPAVTERKFNVLRIQRELGRVYVYVDMGHGFVRWVNFEEVQKAKRAAA